MDQLRSMKLHGLWLRNGNLKRVTESLLPAAQEQALNTNSVRKIYHMDVSNKCRLCRTHVENLFNKFAI